MKEVVFAVAVVTIIYIGFKMRAIQNSLSAAQSVAQSQTGSNIPNIQMDLSDNFMDPSQVQRLIDKNVTTFDIPGDYGTRQRNHVGINGNQMATWGTNYSKSFT